MRVILRSLFMMCLAVTLTGCGYTTQSTLPSGINTIHIESFKNSISYGAEGYRNTYIPLLEVDVRNAVIDRFLLDGNLHTAEADNADLVLEGDLISYQRGALRYTSSDDVEEYRISIIVSLRLWDSDKQLESWVENRFAGEATYFVTGPNAQSEESAIQEAVEDLARRIVERTIEDW